MKLFELFATLGLQTSEFERGIKGAIKQGASFASALSDNFTAISAKAVALGNAMYDIGKAAAKTSVEAVKSIITEFADTEQLLGGVETIFKGSAQRVIDSAGEAFRTAGMSANEYMQTVTSFSSSLLQGLGGDTEAAAKVADMAIQDMSDNANKFGTNIGMIQNAYQGFARDNFTMLDNLKLGYGGTQEEMARLINDSGVLGDTIVTASTVAQVPLDKMFEAIHIIQTEMDITGTTAKEASSTIAGSFNAFTAAWKNAISGMADDKDMDKLIDDLFETGENLVTNVVNLLPRIWRNVASGVESLMEKWDFTRTLKNAYSVGGWAAVWDAATAILKRTLGEWGALALDAGSNVLSQVLTGLTGDTVTAEEIKKTLSGIWEAGKTGAGKIIEIAKSFARDVSSALDSDPQSKTQVTDTLSGLFDAGTEAAVSLLTTASTFVADIAGEITGDKENATKISDTLSELFSLGGEILTSVKDTGIAVFQWFVDNGATLSKVLGPLALTLGTVAIAANPAGAALTALGVGIAALSVDWSTFEENYPQLVEAFESLAGLDFSGFAEGMTSVQTALSNLTEWFAKNSALVSFLLTMVGGAAIGAGHPLIGVGLIGLANGLSGEPEMEKVPEMSEFAKSQKSRAENIAEEMNHLYEAGYVSEDEMVAMLDALNSLGTPYPGKDIIDPFLEDVVIDPSEAIEATPADIPTIYPIDESGEDIGNAIGELQKANAQFLAGLSSMIDSWSSELITAFQNMQFSVDVNTVTNAVNAQNRRKTNAKQWT